MRQEASLCLASAPNAVGGRHGAKEHMADDPIDEEFDEEDLVLEDEELEGDLDEELAVGLDDDLDVEIEGAEAVEEEDAEAEIDAALAARPKREEEEDEEEDINPDDVEADLDEILKDRIAATDDDEDDEEEVAPEPRNAVTEIAEGVTPRKANEFTCTGCFLLVTRGQFGPPGAMQCPVGEAECPAIVLIESGALDTPVTSSTPSRSTSKTSGSKNTRASAATKKSGAAPAKSPTKAPAKKAPAKKAPAKKAPAKVTKKAPAKRSKG